MCGSHPTVVDMMFLLDVAFYVAFWTVKSRLNNFATKLLALKKKSLSRDMNRYHNGVHLFVDQSSIFEKKQTRIPCLQKQHQRFEIPRMLLSSGQTKSLHQVE